LFSLGIYGILGSGTTSTTPGARYGANTWMGNQGDLWLFGGRGMAAVSEGKLWFVSSRR